MGELWTAADDAILDARARVKEAADRLRPASQHIEEVDIDGTTIEFHDPGPWGVCGAISSGVDEDEVVLWGSIGDRIRPGVDIETVLEVENQWLSWESIGGVSHKAYPIRYVAEGEHVFIEACYRPEEYTDDEIFWIERRWESEMMWVSWWVEEHMDSIHMEPDVTEPDVTQQDVTDDVWPDDECCCPDCWAAWQVANGAENLERWLEGRGEGSGVRRSPVEQLFARMREQIVAAALREELGMPNAWIHVEDGVSATIQSC